MSDAEILLHFLAIPLLIAGDALLGIGLERWIKMPLRDKKGRFKAKPKPHCPHSDEWDDCPICRH